MDGLKNIGIYVCNYNKREYVLGCVESLLQQTCRDRDIYVVDNASTDGSAAALLERFGSEISIIENQENIGGSGGFDAAVQDALKKDYQYVVLCDNDVRVDQNAIQIMYEYMEAHEDVGILGPKVLQMEKPELVQDFGGSINGDYRLVGNYTGRRDIDLPMEMDCDYISTCTAMARVSAVRQFGSMPKENFIYWDDVEWSRRCQMSGFRTVAIGMAKVWHNFSEADDPSAFVRYYMTRNQLKFFSKFLEGSQLQAFRDCMLEEIHAKCFMLSYKNRRDLAETIHHAWEDFLNGIEGKARDGRLVPRPAEFKGDSLTRLLEACSSATVEIEGEKEEVTTLIRLLNKIKREGRENRIRVRVKQPEKFHQYLVSYTDGSLDDRLEIEQKGSESDPEMPVVCLCEDIKKLSLKEENRAYIDRFLNCIASREDYEYIKSYKTSLAEFKETYTGLFENRIHELRQKEQTTCRIS